MESLFDRPAALTIGPLRSGTSWIYDYLRGRGDVCLPTGVKEIFYFDRHFQRGAEFYISHFEPKPQHKIIMELTTTAFDNPSAPSHVHKLLGADVKLICPLRHPVERTKAVYMDYVRYGLVRGSIESAADHMPQMFFASRYAENLERWFTQFGKNSVHVLFYETLEAYPDAFAGDLCEALNLPFVSPPGATLWARLKSGLLTRKEAPVVISKEDEAWLKSRLQPEIARLENLLGKPISIWKS